MDNFLQQCVSDILSRFSSKIDDISIILPGKRAAVYLQKYLATHFNQPVFAPEILTIHEWIAQQTKQRILNSQEILFLLFEVHKKIKNNPAEDFNDFLKWARALVNDFDELERYLVNPDSLFRDLRNIREIENWSFNDPELTGGQKNYLKFWEQIPHYYKGLCDLLEHQDEISQGAAYRRIAENIQDLKLEKVHYYFLGFNALSASEERIMKYLVTSGKGTFKTDIDSFYFMNPEHEAGHFYRQLCEKWQIKPVMGHAFNEIPKNVQIIETAQQAGQARICGKLLADLRGSGANLNSMAVVLADESLLLPLLNEIPASIETANITMGYPLRYTQLKILIDQVFELQFNFQKFDNSRLYYKSLLRLLDHPFIQLLNAQQENVLRFENSVIEHNSIFVEWNQVSENFPSLKNLQGVFQQWNDIAREGFSALNTLVNELQKTSKGFELEVLYHFQQASRKFELIWQKFPNQMDLKGFKKMFYQFWQGESLSFLGNPTEGLQIMGILETRLLDFDHLIIPGMNEGNLPQNNISSSTIPFDLRMQHKLPSDEDRQAIFAHHFYRLLHRAKNIYLIYSSGSESVSEQSRYITQLENELDPSKGHTLQRMTYSPDDMSSNTVRTSYHSTPAVQLRLDDFFANSGLSPSALNKLITCPLDFYYRYILKMKENKLVEESIESSTFGTKIHGVLEDIFRKNFLDTGQPLDAGILQREKKNLESMLREKYLNPENENDIRFTASDITYGQNRLSFEISLDFLNAFLDRQIEEINRSNKPIYIRNLEEKLTKSLSLSLNSAVKQIKLTGNADRVDVSENHIRIIDYKSGKCDDEKVVIPGKEEIVDDMHAFFHDPKKGYGRQLLMYALMFRENLSGGEKFSTGIVSMVNVRSWLQNVRIGREGSPYLSDELLNAFEEELLNLIARLYNADFVFEHNPESRYCEHCQS